MRQDTREAIELFVEKAEKLKSFDFVKFPQRVKFSWSWDQGKEKIEITGPKEQDIDAFLLTYRFFFDKKEHCSFRWLAENVLDDSGLSEHWKKEFRTLREKLNHYLDSYPAIRVTNAKNKLPMTNLQVKDLFIFGDLSHATWNKENRENFKRWMSHSATKGLLTSQFTDILFITFDLILKVSDLCQAEIKETC